MAADKIKDGVVVSISYKLSADGVEVEYTTKEEPLDYLHGAENIVPGLEKALEGKQVGDKLTVTLKPDEAYGEYDEDDMEAVDIDDIPDADTLEPGMMVMMEDDEGYVFDATVSEITDDAVIFDFNHELAGKTVTYDVEVIAIREADKEEIAHGHPHSADYDDDE